jgi:uncharacterized protein (DUF2461 family)
MAQSYFRPKVFLFLNELAGNNDWAWWEQKKERCIEVIRESAKTFIEDFGERLQAISDHFEADTRTNGGSLMRPCRDTRFSNPLRTNYNTLEGELSL